MKHHACRCDGMEGKREGGSKDISYGDAPKTNNHDYLMDDNLPRLTLLLMVSILLASVTSVFTTTSASISSSQAYTLFQVKTIHPCTQGIQH